MSSGNMWKKYLFAGCLLISANAFSQKHEFANFGRYAQSNNEVGAPRKGEKRVVLMGNSITDGWPNARGEFFKTNNLIGRGISGQTSYQFLLRFRQDVIDLQPKIVVVNYGTNDIALNTGPYDEDKTFGNGRYVRNLFETAVTNMANRLSKDKKSHTRSVDRAKGLEGMNLARHRSMRPILSEMLREPNTENRTARA
mgnify:CR=1 FL=1